MLYLQVCIDLGKYFICSLMSKVYIEIPCRLIAHHYTFIDKLLPESFQTTVNISRVGGCPPCPPRAGAHAPCLPQSSKQIQFPDAITQAEYRLDFPNL